MKLFKYIFVLLFISCSQQPTTKKITPTSIENKHYVSEFEMIEESFKNSKWIDKSHIDYRTIYFIYNNDNTGVKIIKDDDNTEEFNFTFDIKDIKYTDEGKLHIKLTRTYLEQNECYLHDFYFPEYNNQNLGNVYYENIEIHGLRKKFELM